MSNPHAFINKSSKNGIEFFSLICADKFLSDFFDEWSYKLAKKRKFRTVKAYSTAVCEFINYLLEISYQKGTLSELDLFEALDGYESYLVYGLRSDYELAVNVAEALGDKSLSGSSVALQFAGVNNFLEANEAFRVSVNNLEELGFTSPMNMSITPLAVFGKAPTTLAIRGAVKSSSWLAGCISGGLRRIKKKGLAPQSKPSQIIHADVYGGDEKTFPLDFATDLIKSARNLRDKVLWSLIAATGCRVSEAMTMLRDDVQIDLSLVDGKTKITKCIHIIDPATRVNKLSKYLSETEINSLPHKGRKSPETYLIEPFASLFWKYYDQYTKQQNDKDKANGVLLTHGFLFRKERGGDPITNSYQSLYESFSKSAKELTGSTYGFHSLRHMYGYYLLNYAPLPNGEFGFPIKKVQMFLGHAEIKSTQRYAREDATKLSAALSAMNVLRNKNPHFSINNSKIDFLKSEILRLETEIQRGLHS
ncbi:MAG: integrase [Cocleimonas sp.]|jgi:integrase